MEQARNDGGGRREDMSEREKCYAKQPRRRRRCTERQSRTTFCLQFGLVLVGWREKWLVMMMRADAKGDNVVAAVKKPRA
ncbi:hypothetical protein R1flu_010717 [Riccia fluitans]|uniref:Uncharacterized protein n=1 Tax=Riccia fluitans TaxID=41844 RepID=A0ABD1Z6I4_9MARC